MDSILTDDELRRYSRQIILPELGRDGQERLKNASVLIVGMGGLGSPSALYLAAAGIGRLGLVDFDNVEEHNLHRQIIYSAGSIGESKLKAAEKAVKAINPFVNIDVHNVKLVHDNAKSIIRHYDLVIDCSDNIQTRRIVNNACVSLNKPDIYGSIFRFDGQATVFNYKNGPCYSCLFGNDAIPVQSCTDAGVIGVLPGVIGLVQATEAIKIILGKGDVLSGRLLLYNALDMKFDEIVVHKNKNCAACSGNIANKMLEETGNDEINVHQLKSYIDKEEKLLLLDVRNEDEWEVSNLGQIGARLIPLPEIEQHNFNSLEKDLKIIIYCRTGSRSMAALKIMKDAGYTDLKSLKGGINAWANEIDQSMQVY